MNEKNQTTESRPQVFLSYSHDSEEHLKWVRQLAERMELEGIHVILDQWDLQLGMEIALFMEDGIDNADFVLLICTPTFVQKANLRTHGVGYEASVVAAEMLQTSTKKNKVIAAIRHKREDEAIPRFLRGKRYIDLSQDELFDKGLAELISRFKNRPIYERPQRPETSVSTKLIGEVAKLVTQAEKSEDFLEKFSLYEHAVRIQENAELHRKAAWCALNLNNYKLALKHDQQAVKLDPDFTFAWVGLVVSGSFIGDRSLVESAFKEVEKRTNADDGHYIEAAFYYGQQLFRIGQREEAKPYLLIAANSKKDSDYFIRLQNRALTYLQNFEAPTIKRREKNKKGDEYKA